MQRLLTLTLNYGGVMGKHTLTKTNKTQKTVRELVDEYGPAFSNVDSTVSPPTEYLPTDGFVESLEEPSVDLTEWSMEHTL